VWPEDWGLIPPPGIRGGISSVRQFAKYDPLEQRPGPSQLSDLLAEAPVIVLEALAEILVARMLHRRVSREARECYIAYVLSPAVRLRIDAMRRRRGRKYMRSAKGRYFDLQRLFARLNERFFRGELAAVKVGWSTQNSRTILGHYDSAHRTITISRWLDSSKVPRYLVEYLVFHEMLHLRYPVERQGHRRVVHSLASGGRRGHFPSIDMLVIF